MKKNIILITILAVGLTAIMGCKKFVDVNPPKTEVLTSLAFSKNNSATSAVLAIYTNMILDNPFLDGGITIYSGVSTDDLIPYLQSPTLLQFYQNQIVPTNGTISSMWSNAYKNMAQINTCITGLEASTTLTPSVKAQLLGEAKFCRAFMNFYLVNIFGNVPVITTTDYNQNAVIGQSKPSDTYKTIIADLTDAQALLVNTYPTTGKVRPNKWAATALLARVYLYVNDYANAETQASSVITSGTYGPLPSLNNTFLKGSVEAIWQLLPRSNYSATQEGYAFLADVPYGYPDYYFTNDLLNSFETGDNRKTAWMNNITYQSKVYYYPYKYKDAGVSSSTATINEYYVMLRLSEQYLIRAEARAILNKLPEALTDLNLIRTRAGLTSLNITDQTTLLAAIANENRHEFFAEWGHRWLDLKRLGTANTILSVAKPKWKPTAVFFPIPQTEINLNNNLVQNPGY